MTHSGTHAQPEQPVLRTPRQIQSVRRRAVRDRGSRGRGFNRLLRLAFGFIFGARSGAQGFSDQALTKGAMAMNRILVVGNTGDPATAYQNSVLTLRLLPGTRLITVKGYGRTELP